MLDLKLFPVSPLRIRNVTELHTDSLENLLKIIVPIDKPKYVEESTEFDFSTLLLKCEILRHYGLEVVLLIWIAVAIVT